MSGIEPLEESETARSQALRCIFYSGGIITFLGLYSVLQERTMTEPYDGEYFQDSVFLVLCNRLIGVVFALVMVMARGDSIDNRAPFWKYFAVSIANVLATTCQYEALKYVSLPVQMLGKSFKMLPVMIWSALISNKIYPAKDWLIAAAVTFGVTQFLLGGEISSKRANQGTSIYGILLMGAFLACDGFQSTFQEMLFKKHKMSKYGQMAYGNSAASVLSVITLFVTGGLFNSLSFCFRHPSLFMHAGSLSASAVAGQYCIYSMIAEFGALAMVAAMNVRQVVSILMSCVLFGHPVSFSQMVGLLFVFGALGYKSLQALASTREKEKEQASKNAARTDGGNKGDVEIAELVGNADKHSDQKNSDLKPQE